MKRIIFYCCIVLAFASCKKYLEAKPDATLATLSTVDDLEAFLDNNLQGSSGGVMNTNMPGAADVACDDYYITSVQLAAFSTDYLRDTYLWKRIEERTETYNFLGVQYANIVLDELDKIDPSPAEQQKYHELEGRALFFRGFHHFCLAVIFAQPYNKTTAATDLGLPIRLTPDYNEPSVRWSVAKTYESIIGDLKNSIPLLPDQVSIKTRPSKAAVYGVLSRLYLSIQEYDSAFVYADKYLAVHTALMDFNTVTSDFRGETSNNPIVRFNREVIFHARSTLLSQLATSRCKIDSNLFRSYAQDDLRRTVYFRQNTGANVGTYQFKGDYDGAGTNSGFTYSGVVTDEQFLIRAECYARKNDIANAMKDLNTLVKNRWRAASYTPVTATSATDALDKILVERRKELLFRGTRWMDLRRFMTDPRRAVTPKRIYNTQVYELSPGSLRYTLLFPANVIALTGMPQTP